MRRLEALALAIAHENDALNPGSEAFATLNPGMIRSHSLERMNVVNESGTRVFKKFEDGWRALLSNLDAKCAGKTRAKGCAGKLGPHSTLKDLLKTFHYVQPRKVVELLQDGLDEKAVSESTPLSFFVEI